ncbi:hypothetical protein [Butyrivibrio sp. AE3004]|uniref:hypothetical protein n=1 Tax=Butyrivibrio sp. AE3004 TaxID=1506994 RepID=UPI00068B3C8E|nr:hypothetical protein [Butyrivibrio sp. AE3004]
MKRWRYISNNNSTIVGINDAGIETFTANMNKSLVRENVQNALDAVLTNTEKPVEVEFVLFDVPRERIPDVDTLQDAITKCKKSNRNEPDAFKFFETAEKVISQKKVSVLRISDHNTIGLEGSDTCEKGTSWSRLVKESGSSNKGQGSGGSFGIGKSASFACSDLRTVFYSSKDTKGLLSNIGVAKLVSFEDESVGGLTTGTCYYSDDKRFVAISELAQFDPDYERNSSGTDIYVIGMHEVDDFEKTFTNAVLFDFMVSIIKGKLSVKVQDKVIDKNSLPRYMAAINPYESDEAKELLDYYHILTSNDPTIKEIKLDSKVYGEKYGFKDGECTLYLQESEGLNRKVLITRRAGMRILEQNRISGSIEFSGVMIIDGDNMNEAFKKMEVPSHDAWEPGRCRGEVKRYTAILADFKRYIKGCVIDSFAKDNTTSMDAIGASDFLPDTISDEEEKLKKNELSTRIINIDTADRIPNNKKSKALDLVDVDEMVSGVGSGSHEKQPVPGPNPGPNPPGPNPGPGPGPNPGPEPGPNNGDNDNGHGEQEENPTSYKEISVKKRLICKNASDGVYTLRMIVPSDASKGKLKFSISGEQSDFDLPIREAAIVSGSESTAVSGIIGNSVQLDDMRKGETITLELKVDFDGYCMMEVDYYANKR